MLRKGLYIAGIVLLLLALAAAISGVIFAFWWQLLFCGAVLVASLAFERWRYKPVRDERPDPAWTDTGERFVDPENKCLTGVWFDPASGERHYLLMDGTGSRNRGP